MIIVHATPFTDLHVFLWPFKIHCKYMYIVIFTRHNVSVLFLSLFCWSFSVCLIFLFYYFTFHSSRRATLWSERSWWRWIIIKLFYILSLTHDGLPKSCLSTHSLSSEKYYWTETKKNVFNIYWNDVSINDVFIFNILTDYNSGIYLGSTWLDKILRIPWNSR